MMTYYAEIKYVHVTAVLASGLLFLLRGTLMLSGSARHGSAALRYLSYSIDTVLLTAALMLLTILPAAMFGNGWLLVKMVLLVGYVVLGSLALKRGATRLIQRRCFFLAVMVYVFMLGIARAHHPLGFLSGLLH
jgi:uncharacterized membrane protein SirB2